MPIEIKELHIRVSVNSTPGGQPSGVPAVADGGNPEGDGAKDALVAECVEQVLRILHGKMER
jgi:hypothetical protein